MRSTLHTSSLFTGLAAASLGLVLSPAAAAQNYDLVQVASGLSSPLYVTAAPADARLFALEQNQADVHIIENGVLLATPFIDLNQITTLTVNGERGLLGFAFHPNYTENGYVYVSYTGASGRSKLARLTRDAGNPYVVDPSTFIEFFDQNQPFSNHNGGCIQFGPDGYLYYGLGDGGSSNDPQCRAQNPNNILGKMLRLDVDVVDVTNGYGIPADNPYVGDPLTRDEIYFFGLRNPWRFSFDRDTGDLYIGDVGQDAREEIDVAPFGVPALNFGWKVLEGNKCNSTGNCDAGIPACGSPVYTGPIYQYNHTGGICSVTGGYPYRGSAMPALDGTYFFSDVCTSQFWTLEWDGSNGFTNFQDRTADLNSSLGQNAGSINSFGETDRGELLVVSPSGGGRILQVVPQGVAAAPAPALDTRFEQVSLSSGGTHSLYLDGTAANAGKPYVMLGSASGTTPGLIVDGIALPLNADNYSILLLNQLNSGPFKRTAGLLDAEGRADALIDIAPGTNGGGLIGATVNHAFVVFDAGVVSFASNATELTLLP